MPRAGHYVLCNSVFWGQEIVNLLYHRARGGLYMVAMVTIQENQQLYVGY